jgi:hypothetical protein
MTPAIRSGPPHSGPAPSSWFVAALVAVVALVAGSGLLAPAPATAAGRWEWPVEGDVLTRYANGDDPYAGGQHRGIDIAAPVGEPVRAATDGTVTFAGEVGSSGLTIAVRTGDGRFDTSYLHLESAAVREGDRVAAGDVLGAVGESGRRSAAEPHLHFGVRDAGERHSYRDPLDFLTQSAGPGPEPPPPVIPFGPRQLPRLNPAPALRSAPAGRPVPARRSHAAARPAAARAPVTAPKAAPSAAARQLPAPAPRRDPRPAHEPGRAPQGQAASRREHDERPASSPVPEPSRGPGRVAPPVPLEPGPVVGPRPAAAPAGGFGIGWPLAGCGLVVAIAALLRPVSAVRLGRRAASAVGFALRPLTGRY